MDKNKLSAILFYVAAMPFYVMAVLNFIDKENGGVVFLCLGSAMLCCGSVYLNKYRKNDEDLENKKDEDLENKKDEDLENKKDEDLENKKDEDKPEDHE